MSALTEERIAELASAAFGLGPVVGRPVKVAEAWSNQVVRVRTRSGQYAVKAIAGMSGDALRTGIAVEAAAAATGRIPIPAPVRSPEGDWLVEVPSHDEGFLLRCHEWVDGTPCSAVPPSSTVAEDAGRILGVLHGLRLDGGDSSQLPPVELERWHQAAAAAAGAGVLWAGRMKELTPLVEHVAEEVEQVRQARLPLRMSHDDLDPKNAVVRPDGAVAITDWDYAGPVLPDVELVVAATSFAGDGDPDPLLVRDFVQAYRDAGGDAVPDDPRRTAVEAGRIDWVLRNVEGALRPWPDADRESWQRGAQELLTSYASDVASLHTWAERIRSM